MENTWYGNGLTDTAPMHGGMPPIFRLMLDALAGAQYNCMFTNQLFSRTISSIPA